MFNPAFHFLATYTNPNPFFVFFMDHQPHNNQKLTIDELRNCPGCEHLTDEEAFQVIETVYQLSLIICQIMAQQDNIPFELQHVVHLKNNRNTDFPENLNEAA